MRVRAIRWGRIYHSIIVRVVLFGALAVVLVNGARAYLAHRFLQTETTVSATTRQLNLSRDVAADIAHKVALRTSTLQALAKALPPALLDQPEALREWLRGRHEVLGVLFDGLSVEREDGSIIAVVGPSVRQPFEAAPGGERESVQIGLANRTPALSVTVAMPKSSGHGRLLLRGIGVLAVPGFFDTVQTNQNGASGGVMVVFSKERLFFDLADPAPRLQALPAGGGGVLFDQGTASSQISGPALNPRGQEVLAGISAVPNRTWSVVASMPVAEALLPVEAWSRYFLHSAPFFLPIVLLVSGFASYAILSPLRRTARLADQMSRGDAPLARFPVDRPDEIGAMTSAFNRLLDRLHDQSRELILEKEHAEDATQATNRFLAAASHDLRQPMHALSLYLGALDHFELPSAARPVMASARLCARTMDEMFRALLDISRLDAHVMTAELSVFPLAPLLEEVIGNFAQQAAAKNLSLRVAPCTAYVSSDPELLGRVLSNLVSNAVRYTEHGKVLVGCRRTASGLRLGVYDTGPGIALDHQRAVFNEFYQVDSPARNRAQGIGLGLAIVQRLCALLKVPLALRSELGRGSVFSLELPIARPKPARFEAPEYSSTGARGALEGTLIAVIDDEPLILDATALLLRQWGCTVVTATSGSEAIERLGACARVPDAIVCDHRLGGVETGVDVISALRAEYNSDIPAMLITGETSAQSMGSILDTGIPVVNKPLQDHALMDALLRLLNHEESPKFEIAG